MRKGVGIVLFVILIFAVNFAFSASVENVLHLNIQVVNSSNDAITGTFSFVFNISTTSNCANIVYTNSSTLTTDSHGGISYYLGNVNLNFSDQYWLCYYRDGTLINASKIAQVPYAFRAKNVTLSGVDVDTNFALGIYNITASIGSFGVGLSVSGYRLNVLGNVNVTGNLTLGGNYLCNVTNCFSLADLNATGTSGGSSGNYFNQQLNTTSNVFFVSLNTANNFYVNGSNVGIGTTSPTSPLEIAKSAGKNELNVSGVLYVNSSVNANFGGVGIGTSEPAYSLDVQTGYSVIRAYSTNNLPAALLLENGIQGVFGIEELSSGGFWASDTSPSAVVIGTSSNTYPLQFVTGSLVRMTINGSTGNVGIGTASPAISLDFGSGTGFSGNSSATPPSGLSYGMFPYSGVGLGFASAASGSTQGMGFFTYNGSTWFERVRIVSGGNVGIGTTNPNYRLTVNASGGFAAEDAGGYDVNNGPLPIAIKLGADSTALGIINKNNRQAFALNIDGGGGTNSTRGVPTFYDKYDGTWHASISLKNGNVGIGTSSPASKLEVAGVTGQNTIYSTSSGIWISVLGVNANTGTGVEGIVNGDGIGVYGNANSASSYGIYCYSGVNANGCGGNRAWYTASDLKLKENISTIQDALNKTLSLRGVVFNWKTNDTNIMGERDMGFIAQEVMPYVPEVVSYDSLNGYYGMKTSQLTALLVEAMQEQQKIILSQNNTINKLMKELCKKDKTYSWC